MKPPQLISDLCQALVHGLQRVLGDKLYGVYMYGAAAFPEAAPTGDIDFHVILAAPLTEAEKDFTILLASTSRGAWGEG